MEQITFDFDVAEPLPQVKLCECGCEKPTSIARRTDPKRGHVKGQPYRFLAGHGAASPRPSARTLFAEPGQRIGWSTVISPEFMLLEPGRKWPARAVRLRCDCGREYERALKTVFRKTDQVESCGGCPGPDDLTGQRFGKLTVVRWQASQKPSKSVSARRNGKWIRRWLCVCNECGKEIAVTESRLADPSYPACGCGNRAPRLPAGEAAFNRTLTVYRKGAQSRNHPWELTRDDFRRLTSMNCHYCGGAPAMVTKVDRINGSSETYTYNGIDRVDNALGYFIGNVAPACWNCNHSKVDLSLDAYLAWGARFAAYQATNPDMTLPGPFSEGDS
jgi:hypothetical protein